MGKALDLTNRRFGRLVAKRPTEKRVGNFVCWECECDCDGKIVVVPTGWLTSNRVLSCGCLQKESTSASGKKNIIKAQNRMGYIDNTLVDGLTSKIRTDNKTGVRGVFLNKQGRYQADIVFKKKRYRLGSYKTLGEATKVRKEAEDKLFGEFLDWYYKTYPNAKR